MSVQAGNFLSKIYSNNVTVSVYEVITKVSLFYFQKNICFLQLQRFRNSEQVALRRVLPINILSFYALESVGC